MALALEYQLRGATEKLQELVDIVAALRPDQAIALDGRFIYVGSAFSAILGCSCDDPADFDLRQLAETGTAVVERARGDFKVCEVDSRVTTPHSLKSVVDHADEAGWIATGEGFVEYCNPWWTPFSGIPENEFRGAGCALIIHPEDALAGSCRWENAQKTARGYQADVRFRHLSGEYRHFNISVQPMYGPSGTIEHWLGTGRSLLS